VYTAGMRTSLTTPEMEQILAEYFDYRQKLIVPRVSWGFNIHELDLAIVTESKYLWEVEIKVSAQDLKKDKSKRHGHYDSRHRVKRLYFAVPAPLAGLCLEVAPERAGVLSIAPERVCDVSILRKPKDDKQAEPLTDEQVAKISRLGTLRVWSMQQKLHEARLRIDELRPECPHMFKPKRITDSLLSGASGKELECWREMYAWYAEPRLRIDDELKRRRQSINYQI